MIIDHRTYNVKVGKLNDWLKLYETEALPLQMKYLGHCVGWYVSNDIGPLSQVVHMWAYKTLMEREERRGKMLADPAWGAFLAKSTDMLINMETKIVRPAPWFKVPDLKT
jgi:NIPSNAP